MQFNVLLSCLVLLSAVSAVPMELVARGNFTGLDLQQSHNAKYLVKAVRKAGLDTHACQTVFVTALQESQIYIYANDKVPSSLNFPHDKVGGDQDSVGIFQQRPEWYPDIAANMDPEKSTSQFLSAMITVANWQNIDPATLAQDVQKSERPDAYAKHMSRAKQLCAGVGFT